MHKKYNRLIRVIVMALVALGLVLVSAVPAQSAPNAVDSNVLKVVGFYLPADVTREAPALTMGITGTTGGGTTCTAAGAVGRVCAILYRGQSGFHRPYMRIDQSSTSPSVTSASAVVGFCTLNTFNQCSRLQNQNFGVTQGLNKRPRCGVIIRGEVGDNLPCEVGGAGYTPGVSRTRTIVTLTYVVSGKTYQYKVYSPILTVT